MTTDPNPAVTPPAQLELPPASPSAEESQAQAARIVELEREKKDLLDRIQQGAQQPPQPGQLIDPTTGRPISVDDVVLAASDPSHPLHNFARVQIALAQDSQAQRAERERERREEQAYRKVPEPHRDAVEKFFEANRNRFADPEAAYGYLRGTGSIKDQAEDERRKQEERVAAERRAAAAGLPNPSAVVPAGQTAEVQEIPRSEYLRRLKTEPELRKLRDTNKLVVTEG